MSKRGAGMKQCPKCKYMPAEDDLFCAKCGTELEQIVAELPVEAVESLDDASVENAEETPLDKKSLRKLKKQQKKEAKRAKKEAKKAEYLAKPLPSRLSASALIAFIFAFYALVNWLNPVSVFIAFAAVFMGIIGIRRTRRGMYAGRSLAVSSVILAVFLFVAQFLTLAAVAYMINLPAVTSLIGTVGSTVTSIGNLFDQFADVLTELQKVLPIITDAASAMSELAGVVHSLSVVINLLVEILTKIRNLLLLIPLI